MGLQEAVEKMHGAHNDVLDVVKEKMSNWEKFDKEMAALDKAKDEKGFKKQKDKCLKALKDVLQSMQLQSVATDTWATSVSDAKSALAKERKSLAETKDKMTQTAKQIEAHNKQVNDFNKTPAGKQQPRKLLPVLDALKATAPRQEALDVAELDILGQEAFVKVNGNRASLEGQVVNRELKKVNDKEFNAKGAKR